MINSVPSQVTIIITAWNQLEKTAACLESITTQTYTNCKIILVDNGSEPSFATAINGRFPHINMLRNEENLGFAAGYNRGIQAALQQQSPYFLILNNDTILPENFLAEMVAALDNAPPHVALATAKIYYLDTPEVIWSVGADFRPFLLELQHDQKGVLDQGQFEQARLVEMAPFCGLLARRTLFEQVGLLDEAFFLYYEDMDYCVRMKAAGKKIVLAPKAKLYHAVSASSGGAESASARYWLASSSGRYFRKHGHGWRMLLIIPFRLASAIRLSIRLLLQRNWPVLTAYWRGLADGWIRARFS